MTTSASAEPALDPWQLAAVEATGPVLVVGGPGSGKTTVAVAAAARGLALAGADGPAPLVLTFSRRAASDLRNRVVRSLARTVVPPRVQTPHAFARSLLTKFTDPDLPEPRLLTAPEQEFRVRELLLGGGPRRWPEEWREAFGTRAFARQVRAALARARQLGLDPEDVIAAGEQAQRPEWSAVGRFFDEYLDVLDHEGSLDYAELIHRARILLADPVVVSTVRDEIGSIIVDEYGELDPAQIGMIRAISPAGGSVLALADPDQVVFRFRGSHPRGIAEFPQTFTGDDGQPAPVLLLPGSHRLADAHRVALAGVLRRVPVGLTGEAARQLRSARAEDASPARDAPDASVDVVICPGEAAANQFIAQTIRSARLDQGLEYADMAVIVRSGRGQLAGIARALAGEGIPVEVAGDEIPLSSELAVRPLLLALGVIGTSTRVTADEAKRLLCSPLGGFDAVSYRRLCGALHAHESAELGSGVALPTGAELVARAVSDPTRIAGSTEAEVLRLQSFLDLLERGRTTLGQPGNGPAEALWVVWSGTPWPEQLAAESAAGGDPGRLADRALDAVVALFAAAEASAQPPGRAGVRGFLAEVAAQEIPADTEREADLAGRGVRLLTAHRAKGGQWPLVIVAGVQEGVWPAPPRAGDLLAVDELVTEGLLGTIDRRAQLADERRLFHLACSRSGGRLVVVAVEGSDGEANQPSRFLAELGVPIRLAPPALDRPLTLAALTAELRQVATGEGVSAELRRAAVVRLAAIGALTDANGRARVPQADPRRWWGVLPSTGGALAAAERVRLSATQLSSVLTCPRQYVLARRVKAEPSRSSAAGLGSVIHTLAEYARTDSLTADELQQELDRVWDQIPFDAVWMSSSERVEAELALTRFLTWQQAHAHADVVGVETEFSFDLDLPEGPVTLTGTVDRLERLPDGRLRIIDFKTGRRTPTAAEVSVHDQLGLYQLAAEEGAFAGVGQGSAGGTLVYLRRPDGNDDFPKTFHQAALGDQPHPAEAEPSERPTWVHDRVGKALRVIHDGSYPATAGPQCRWCAFTMSCPADRSGGQAIR